MLTCQLVKISDVSAQDIDLWRQMNGATPLFASPLLSPDFTQAVALCRDDVRVAVYRRGPQITGFLPHHRRPHRFARPAGAPFADYTALITFPDPEIDGPEALKLAGIDRFQAIGLVDPYHIFGTAAGEADMAYGIDMRPEAEGIKVSKKHSKNINRHRRNLIEAHGPIRIIVGDRNRRHYDRMLHLKREQMQQNGLHDFLQAPWANQLFEHLYDAPVEGLHGSLLTMMVGDVPAMFHYGLRLGDRMHPWVSSFDPAFGPFSPGQIFLTDAQVALRAAGVAYYDLSTGQSHYKNSFSNHQFPVLHARLYGASDAARREEKAAHLSGRFQAMMGAGVSRIFGRMGRRFDQIACLELDFVSRARGVAYAFAAAPKRNGAHDAG
ncbi:MAG: GNAT family N-acetyltransferase [Asticcacaulis sp.]